MIRWNVLAAAGAVVVGAAFVTGKSIPPKPLVGPPAPEAVKAMPPLGQKTGYFNMAKVMREYKKAQSSVELLNARKNRMVKNLIGLRAMLLDLKAQHDQESNKPLPLKDGELVFQLAHQMTVITRTIQDMEQEVNKLLNNQASTIICEIHDTLRATTAEMAREHALVAVLAFPSPATAEEAETPMVKELMLKPQAAQPFYLDATVDYTDELIDRLNTKFAAENGGN